MRAGCWLLPALLLAAAPVAPVAPVAGGGRTGPGSAGSPRGPGEPCGVYTPGCARGLRCIPRAGERAPLRALLRGTGVCRPLRARPAATGAPAGDSRQESPPPTPPPPAAGPEELETAPCRGHLAAAVQELRAGLYRSAAAIFLPNCDTRGFYRPQQCRASQGPKRGRCWCVDPRGHPLAGTEGRGGPPAAPPPERPAPPNPARRGPRRFRSLSGGGPQNWAVPPPLTTVLSSPMASHGAQGDPSPHGIRGVTQPHGIPWDTG
ncbi:insulin-like growth factor-binding protein 6 [Rhynochetos jubatus]